MSPLYATFAWPLVAVGAAAAAVAVPVLIHWLSRQRYQVVRWAAIRFLLAAQKQHRRRIDRWLLLALRALVLLLLLAGMCAVASWAERIWQGISPGAVEVVTSTPRTHHILVLDASLSMTAKVEGGTNRFDRAISLLERQLEKASPGDGFSLIFLGSGIPQAVVPGPSTDTAKVLAELRALKVTHAANDYAPALAMIADMLGRSPRNYARRQVTFFSDMQRSAWSAILPKSETSAPEAWKRIVPRADIVVVDTAGADADNLAVVDVSLASPLAIVGETAAITAAVHNFSRVDRKKVRVDLQLGRPNTTADSVLASIDSRTIDSLPSGQRVSITFPLKDANRFRDAGLHIINVRVAEEDALVADDTRSIAVEVRDSLTVLVVGSTTGTDGKRTAAEYVQLALAPKGDRTSFSPARPKLVSPAVFADPFQTNLAEYDCVVLCDVPPPSEAMVARLEGHLKRGGGLILSLGPTAAANLEAYNRSLRQDGNGLLPGKLLGTKAGQGNNDAADFRLAGDDAAFRRPPLALFATDTGLTDVPFRQYLRLDAPRGGQAERILSFVPALAVPPTTPATATTFPDPAVVSYTRHHGRVVVITTALNQAWSEWPILPSFLPFVHETVRYVAMNPDRHTLRVGEPIEEMMPAIQIGSTANVIGPDGSRTTVPIVSGDETGLARFSDTTLSGLYQISSRGRRTSFAVVIPESNPGGGSESDLTRIDPARLRDIGPIQVVNDPSEPIVVEGNDTLVTYSPRPHGPKIARWVLSLALFVSVVELAWAWWVGPGRTGISGRPAVSNDNSRTVAWFRRLTGFMPLFAACLLLGTVVHAEAGGTVLGVLPDGARQSLEQAIGVPSAGPGEGTRWRLESSTVYLAKSKPDRWLLMALLGVAATSVVVIYALERRATRSWRRLFLPLSLRVAVVGVIGLILLPQQRLAFDREGWPDVAILLDTSASMSTIDEFRDPAVKAKAEELIGTGLPESDRLRLACKLLTRKDGEWLFRLMTERQVKLHIYSMADQARLIAAASEPTELKDAATAIDQLKADGESSRLGDAVVAVLKTFRGGSLAAVVALTDGITTAGEDLTRAGREAARAGVPLYLVGLGDSSDPPDLAVGDVKCDDEVLLGDRLEIQARVTARGPNPPGSLPAILYERQGDTLIERARQSVVPNADGQVVRLQHTPTVIGEKTYVVVVPPQPGETELGNNRVERTVVVTDSKRLKVLYIDGYPRYEYRFLKALLERETDQVRGNKSVELGTMLLDASRGYADLDKSALASVPTKNQLAEYDVVILGDVNPSQVPRSDQFFGDLVDFVKIRGGGLIFLAGEHANPHKLFDTTLVDLLPIVPTEAAAKAGGIPPTPESSPLTATYRPTATPLGRAHPLLRFSADEADNEAIWKRLKPFYWSATGYQRKAAAEVLAVNPDRPAEGDAGTNHPVVLQQFVGAGRVIFLGFDETWRWRHRSGEERYNQFWTQAVRTVARSKVVRIDLRTDKPTAYRRDEPIRLSVRFPDDAPAPAADTPVRVNVVRNPLTGRRRQEAEPAVTGAAGTSDSYVVQLSKVEGSRANYESLITRTPEGQYTFTLVDPKPTGRPGLPLPNQPRAEASVLPPPGERERLEMNRAELLRATVESRGKFYSLAGADRLIDELPEVTRQPLNQPCPPLTIWNQWLMFVLLVLLFAVEWWSRRHQHLV